MVILDKNDVKSLYYNPQTLEYTFIPTGDTTLVQDDMYYISIIPRLYQPQVDLVFYNPQETIVTQGYMVKQDRGVYDISFFANLKYDSYTFQIKQLNGTEIFRGLLKEKGVNEVEVNSNIINY